MADDQSKSLDVLGVKPLAEAASAVTKGMVDGASAFLSRICLPAAEEFGFLLQDKVRAYRSGNMAKIAAKAEARLAEEPDRENVHGHPRLIGMILEHGSWIDADDVQGMWAGLLASSCNADGQDDSNLMFVDLLSRLSASQARIVEYACLHCLIEITEGRLIIMGADLPISLSELQKVTGLNDVQRLDRELDHLRSLGLIDPHSGGFESEPSQGATITPTALALQMFVRVEGYRGDPPDFYILHRYDVQKGETLI